MIRKAISVLLACILALGISLFAFPSLPVLAATETLRPNAVGDETAIENSSEATHWEAVDEAAADGMATYVSQLAGVWKRDLYNLPAHSGTGTINSITVYYTAKLASDAGDCDTRASIKIDGITYDGDINNVGVAFIEKSEVWAENPASEAAWTWADIDDLQIGVSLWGRGIRLAICTQVYVVVDYTAATAPAITTDAATYVTESTARLNSTVDDDGNEACDVRFGYGTTTQANVAAYDIQTAWVENTYTTGQHPFVNIDSLNADDEYFFRVAIRNDHSTVEGGELTLDTEAAVGAPSNLKAYPGSVSVGLTWTTGTGSAETMIRYSEVTYPADETEGIEAYVGSLSSYTITGLVMGHTYYIVAIGKSGADYSATVEVLASTSVGEDVGEEPSDAETPTTWWQSPDYTGLSDLPLYDQVNDLFDAFEMPRGSGWFLGAILGCVVVGVAVYAVSRQPVAAVIALSVALTFASLIKLLPLFMMAFAVLFMIGVWQFGRSR